MANPQDKSGDETARTGSLSRVVSSEREHERVQVMEDGTDMSVVERLDYAVRLVPEEDWADRFGRSAKQLRRYLDGSDIPFSVMNMIGSVTGVPVDWLASGRPTYGPSKHDEWRERLAPDGVTAFPSSTLRRSASDMAQGSELASNMAAEEVLTINGKRFRVAEPNPETLEPLPGYVVVPRYDVRASAGEGNAVTAEDLKGYLALEDTFLREVLHRRRQDIVSIEATGDSMTPTILDGDLLIVDTTVQDIHSSRIYVLHTDRGLLVKRLSLRLDGTIEVRSDNPKYDTEYITPSERTPLRIIGQVVYQAGPVRS